MVAYLLGIDSVEELRNHFIYGSLFENLIVTEELKRIYNNRKNERLYFWRDNKGVEVDLIIDKGLCKQLVEIKSSRTFNAEYLKNIQAVRPILQNKYDLQCFLTHSGSYEQLVNGIQTTSWDKYLSGHHD